MSRSRSAASHQQSHGHGSQGHGSQGHGYQGHGSQGHRSQGHGSQGHGSQGHGSTVMSWILSGRPYDKSSIDSQFTDVDEELTVLEACIDCDDEALYEILQNGVTYEHVNEQDKSGRVSTSL